MRTELVTLTKDNPLKALEREDHTWSAREVHASGQVHADWRNWEAAIKRGDVLLYKFGISAGQSNVGSTTKNVEVGFGSREVNDYNLTPLALYAACQQSGLPELDLWFVFAGMQAAGYGQEKKASAPRVGSAAYYDLWLRRGCVEFHDNGRPKVFDPNSPLFAANLIRGVVAEVLSSEFADLKAAFEVTANEYVRRAAAWAIGKAPAAPVSNYRGTPGQDGNGCYSSQNQ